MWGTGQDQMRVVKQRLLEMLPDASIFLDVDDLAEGKGAEYVDVSSMSLVFCSAGYFQSPNCMRELLRAGAGGLLRAAGRDDAAPAVDAFEAIKAKYAALKAPILAERAPTPADATLARRSTMLATWSAASSVAM